MARLAILVRSSVIQLSDLPAEVAGLSRKAALPSNGTGAPSLKDIERSQILKVLEEEGWHREGSANRLGLPLRTLYRKIRAYNRPAWGPGGVGPDA